MPGVALTPPSMVVKDVVGRSRHIVFTLACARPPTRRDIVSALRAIASSRLGHEVAEAAKPRLTVFEEGYGIVRVLHFKHQAIADAIRDVRWIGDKENASRLVTLGTSGTLRGAKRILARERARATQKMAPNGPPSREI